MRLRSFLLAGAIAATLLQIGCDAETGCGDVAPTPQCSHELDSAGACKDQGGCWGRWTQLDVDSCNCPTTDHGKACASAGDCQGECSIEGANPQSSQGCPVSGPGTCSKYQLIVGCRCVIGSAGEVEPLCSD